MFDMQLPWWEFVVRGATVYFLLLLMVRISGKRTVGQFTPFDLLVVMLLSEAVSNSLSGGDDSLVGGLVIAMTLMGLNMLIAYATSRNRKMAQIVDGTAVLIGRDGQIFSETLKREHVGMDEVDQALRESDCTLEEMKCAFLEADGRISILKK